MPVSKSLSAPHFRVSSRPSLGRRGSLALAAATLCALSSIGAAAPQSKMDQVSYVDGNGRARSHRGVVQENTLERTVIEVDGSKKRVDSDKVTGITFGAVPESYNDAVAYFDRRDFENAAKSFQVAAGDGASSDVVKASARMLAARSWMSHGAADPSGFGEAQTQVDALLASYPDNRDVPAARLLLARAKRMAGDAAGAAEEYKALYAQATPEGTATGYSAELCYEAGLGAAQASLTAGDVDGANALFNEVSSRVASLLAGMNENDVSFRAMTGIGAEARLGEGFCLLARGSNSQARTFFQGQLSSAPKTGALRQGARLGLAEALLAGERYREASIEFAKVNATDFSNRDRMARSLLGLAQCYLNLPDTDGRQQAKTRLEAVRAHYGDTPSALRAQELLKTL